MKFKKAGKTKKDRKSIKERIYAIDIDTLTFSIIKGLLKYGGAALLGAFVMYCSVKEDFKLSGSTAISLKGDGVDVSISRQDIKEYLEESDRQAILNMTDLAIHEEFYKDIDVSSKEDQQKIQKYYDAYIKEVYGDKKTFNSYQKVYKLSSDYIRRCMAIDVKQEKKLKEMEDSISIDKSSLETEWKTNKESYQYITCDAVVFMNQEDADNFYSQATLGKPDYDSLDLTKAQVGYDEKIYFNDSRLKYSLSKKYKSDVISTYTVDGYPMVMVVSDRKVTQKDLKSDMVSALKSLNAKDKLSAKYDEFESSLEISVESEKVDNSKIESDLEE